MSRYLVLSRLLRRGLAVGLMLLFAQPGQASTSRDPLKMFQRYIGTIDIRSNGKGVRGTGQFDPATGKSWATATIKVDDVPPNVEILSAFVYYEVFEKTDLPSSAVVHLLDPNVVDPTISPLNAPPNPDPATAFNQPLLQYPVTAFAKPLGNPHSAVCWSNGGSTGNSNGAPTLVVYRLEAKRYLKIYPLSYERIPIITIQVHYHVDNEYNVL